MTTTDKLIEKARRSPTNFTFEEICLLAERVGFIFRRQAGSHRIYKHPLHKAMMNFQPDKRDPSKAKGYQIKQLLDFIKTMEK
jgi:predicted RNA binding protein YcfA (HicA-like mRNA interferase family)